MQIMTNSEEHIKNSQVDESMKDLVLAYIKAKNADDDAKAEVILHEINELRRLTNDKVNTQHKNKSA
mgnify:CR=1 FL=1